MSKGKNEPNRVKKKRDDEKVWESCGKRIRSRSPAKSALEGRQGAGRRAEWYGGNNKGGEK